MTTVQPARAFAWMITAQALFAVMALSARFVGRGVPWQEVAAARMLVALVLTWGIARARGRPLRVKDRKHAWLRSICGTLATAASFYVYARPLLPIGDAVTVLCTSPLFVVVLAPLLLRERVSARLGVAMLASFAGVWAVAEPSFGASRTVIAVCLFSALCSALARIWLRRMGPNESSEAIVFHFMAVATVVLGLMSIPCWKTPDLESAAFLVLTGVTGGLAQLAMTRAYALDQAPRVSAVGYAGVVFTRLFAAPVFDEIPSPLQIAGSLLVIGAGVSMALGGTRAARAELELEPQPSGSGPEPRA